MARSNMSLRLAWSLCRSAGVTRGCGFDINLEDQILITENGFKNLTTYKFDRVSVGEGDIITIRKTHENGHGRSRAL